jgi:hypothetical protein
VRRTLALLVVALSASTFVATETIDAVAAPARASDVLATLQVKGRGPKTGYSRDQFGAAWAGFAPNLDRWMKVIEHRGPAAVQRAYLDTLNGHVPPDQGLILSL